MSAAMCVAKGIVSLRKGMVHIGRNYAGELYWKKRDERMIYLKQKMRKYNLALCGT